MSASDAGRPPLGAACPGAASRARGLRWRGPLSLLTPALIVLSPHLDDAVLSCGALLATRPGTRVVTVFAGTPPDPDVLTDWDGRCGFRSAAEAMQARREEDRRALERLLAVPVHLDFLDAQYGATPREDRLRDALARLLAEDDAPEVLLPMGLFHSDHLLVHRAARAAVDAVPGRVAVAWEDVPYRHKPGLLQQRLAALAAEGIEATPWSTADDGRDPRAARAKHEALAAYATQLPGLGPNGIADALRPERCWQLRRRDDGHAEPAP